MVLRHVLNEYKAVTYMCRYFSKTEDQCLQVIKQAAKKAFENNMHYHDTIKIIAKAYLSNPECFVHEAVYHILPELKLRRMFLAVHFVNEDLSDQRVQILLSEKELTKLPEDYSNYSNVFKKSNINRYMERLNATFCNEK